MGAKEQFLTTREYADQCGLSVSKVTKRLRDGSLKGQKVAGKWTIPASELDKASTPTPPAPQKQSPSKTAATAARTTAAARTRQQYSVAEFSAMTYLTENGVRSWLKKGLIKGTQSEKGQWRIDAANLEAPHIKRLVR
jgi:hypothetical protein